jgi:ketosteroid isomerase-like protein
LRDFFTGRLCANLVSIPQLIGVAFRAGTQSIRSPEVTVLIPFKIAFAVCITVATFIQQTPNKPDISTDSAELSRLEKVWNEAHVNGDADALERLWADDLTVAVPNMAVITKQTALSMAKSGRIKFKRYETSDIKIRVYSDAAVVTGIVERTRNMNSRDVDDKWRFTKVYIRRAGRWQVVAWHASTIDQ